MFISHFFLILYISSFIISFFFSCFHPVSLYFFIIHPNQDDDDCVNLETRLAGLTDGDGDVGVDGSGDGDGDALWAPCWCGAPPVPEPAALACAAWAVMYALIFFAYSLKLALKALNEAWSSEDHFVRCFEIIPLIVLM